LDDTKIENIILENLINNDEYFRAAIPHLKEAYFETREEQTLLKFIQLFSDKHNKPPNQKILSLMVREHKGFSQDEFDSASELVKELSGKEENKDWLLERTEQFCRDKAVYNAIMDSINIIDGKDKSLDQGAIPSILQDALSISFDKSVGHNFFDDAGSRFDFYHAKEERVPFHLSYFNKITKGGLPKKSLSVILAGTGVGKSLFMCDHAANAIKSGYNCLYVTLEMAEERIAERIDCNVLDITLDGLSTMKKEDFISGIKGVESKSHGKLVIKEYPTGSASAAHIRSLLEELKLKQNFIPDMIYIDYLNICSSSRFKSGGNHNSYTIVKSITEEMRGLAVEYNVPILSATQTTRGGNGASDIEISDTSESIGLPQSVDMLFAIIRTEELDKMGQVMVKQLKSRFGDISYYRKFLIGIDLSKFKFYDVEDSSQCQLSDSGKIDSSVSSVGMRQHDFSDIDFS
jgi:archaellum biogenesis ATPase FlaH